MTTSAAGDEQASLCDDRPMVGLRERIISGLVVFFLTMLAVINVPVSKERAAVLPHFAAPIDLLHLNQSWAVFSPDPSRSSIEFWAEVELVSGDTVRYEFPAPGLWSSVYTDYRFRKYQRRMVESGDEFLQTRAADRIRREFDEPVESVTLMAQFVVTAQPGSGHDKTVSVQTLREVPYGPGAPDAASEATP